MAAAQHNSVDFINPSAGSLCKADSFNRFGKKNISRRRRGG